MDWAEDYISRCLRDIPKGKYRERLRRELSDHLAELAGDVSHAGRSEAEARAEALRQMGDAAALNEGFWAEWLRQPERLGYDLKRLFGGCLLAGVTFYFGMALVLIPLLIGNLFTLPGLMAGKASALQSGLNGLLEIAAGAALYAAAFVPNALYLRKAFRRRPRRPALVGGGLLLSWAVGKGSAALLMFPEFGFWNSADIARLLRNAELAWFRWPLVALSLLGCAALGWLFGRDRKRERTEETKDEA